MDKTEAKPEIRFKGFSAPWEQRKLGELLKTIPFKIFLKEIEIYGRYEVIQQGNVPVIGYANGEPCLDYEDSVVFGDHTLSIYKPKGPFFVATDGVRIIKGLQKMNGNYLLYLLEKYRPQSEGYKRYYSILIDVEAFMINNKLEQEKIGEFFSNLNSLITLQESKLEKINNLKKAMLEKMFPKDGTDTPEVRFKGFSAPWEQRKLSKIASMHARIGWQNLRKSEFLDSGDYYLITGTDFVDGRIEFKNCHYVEYNRYIQDQNIQIKNGCILITKDGTLGKVAYVDELDKPATLNAGLFNIKTLSDDTDKKYLFQYLKAPFLMSYVEQNATGGTIKHLNQNILIDFPVDIPSTLEQSKIGEFFSNLDSLIALQQNKLQKLRNIKKACLEKMFV